MTELDLPYLKFVCANPRPVSRCLQKESMSESLYPYFVSLKETKLPGVVYHGYLPDSELAEWGRENARYVMALHERAVRSLGEALRGLLRRGARPRTRAPSPFLRDDSLYLSQYRRNSGRRNSA